ncbi:hypothetical protein M427DRAFT_263911 [Gonapodya prolifera JEL478]|uniref:SMC hinge domain-containing protein n=1 Tax=Gonapodya prolifera (strain JEL478) TaxID=1344416 RepID=A0A139AKS3_GONPJ|nr:hypothetical protein M427DRAFT_263911 [Gonapodya prolifera JEL478]|eukprot:KXS17124.1 hypothetical protein M427DRAFT_263911 [Gonapodya prolifera JEL478]
MEPKQTPENAPRLFDLVKPKDPKFAPAFYSVLNDTIVATDLEQANRLAFGGEKRWRVVTFDGQLIDTTGTMSGGGTKVARGLMVQKFKSNDVTEADVVKIEKQKLELEAEMKEVVAERKRLDKAVEELLGQASTLEMSIEKVKMEKSSLEVQIAEIMKQVSALGGTRPDSGDLARMKQLETSISKLEKEFAALRKPCEEVEGAITDLQNKILEVGGTKLRSQSSRLEDVVVKIESTSDKITQTTVAKKAAEKSMDKTLKANQASAKELEETETQLAALMKEIETKMEAGLAVKRKADRAQEILDSQKEKLEELSAQQKERHTVMQNLRRIEVDLNNKMDDLKREVQVKKKELVSWTSEVTKLTLQKFGFSDEEDEEELPAFSEEELAEFDVKELQRTMAAIEAKLNKAQPNLNVLQEYKEREEEYFNRVREMDEATKRRDDAKAEYEGLRKRRLEEFMKGFTAISNKLKEMYQVGFGSRHVELVPFFHACYILTGRTSVSR